MKPFFQVCEINYQQIATRDSSSNDQSWNLATLIIVFLFIIYINNCSTISFFFDDQYVYCCITIAAAAAVERYTHLNIEEEN